MSNITPKSKIIMVATSLFTALTLSVAVSHSAYAVKADEDSAVSQNFKKMGRGMRGINDAKNSAELLEILEKARVYAAANKEEIPSFMEADTEQLNTFHEGIDDLVSRIDKAIELAKADDFDGAMAQFKDVRDAKGEYHEKFEIEDEDH